MKFLTLYIVAILVCCSVAVGYAQQQNTTVNLRIQVNDEQTKGPLEFALIYLGNEKLHREAICDAEGLSVIEKLPRGKYKMIVSLLGYKKWEKEVSIEGAESITVLLSSNSSRLNEVVVTASESKGITSSSIIDQKAMQHLQPSSFTDILELLPGGKAMDPNFSKMNAISIREAPLANTKYGNYSISSLGTSFVIDGVPISTDANMQILAGGVDADQRRSTMNRGVDMRTISTDQIEKVEVVRGIPSVQYGDLTSGLVRIERKKGATPWNTRLKIDGYSKLLAINKGFYFKKNDITLNIGGDFLDSKNTPTNSYEGFQRFTYSVRLGKQWNRQAFSLDWKSNFDHGHTFDDMKTDPNRFDYVEEGADIESLKKERYKSKYDRLSLSNNFSLKFHNALFLKSVDLKTSVAYEMSKIKRNQLIQKGIISLPASDEEGISYGIFLPGNYMAYQEVDGKPLNIFLQGKLNMEFSTAKINHKVIVGGEYTFDKNYGKGNVTDRFTPISESAIRARKFSDIPAKQNLSFFIEDGMSVPVNNNIFKLNAGIRGMSMVSMDSQYKMSGKIYLDPRFNAEWSFPAIGIKDKDFNISVAGGIGWHSKFPTLNQIYPDYTYWDYVRLNYYDTNNADHRWVNYETYKDKTVNYALEPARNKKWEVRLNLQYDNNNLSVTYFKESMTNGFRTETMGFSGISYKKYKEDSDYLVLNPETGMPDLNKWEHEIENKLHQHTATGNGTTIDKEGIEYTFSTKRFEQLKTRLTINGAWFKTNYLNSGSVYKGASAQINGKPIQEIGVYDSSGGYYREQFNTNFMVDTYIPILDLEFSTSFQCMWYTIGQNIPVSRYPYAYIDINGVQQPYTEADKSDAVLGKLMRESNPGMYKKERIPLGVDINLKASKKIKDIMRISLFVNKLLEYYPDYTVNGAVIKRTVSPYFGMELNITL